MGSVKDFETISTILANLGRAELKWQILNFEGRFPLDFTESYLDSLSTDKLRHILLAAKMVN